MTYCIYAVYILCFFLVTVLQVFWAKMYSVNIVMHVLMQVCSSSAVQKVQKNNC